ncbi:D-alanyl-D-alanine carboxypeptidase [Roseibacterium sp. SDUM158016]|jgi:D-alanyl-D-alanine carboxypeptidase (penicillin-binding protein 5/6)|uniref:D-alanyl-D-alanine carboxypeptidase family protein n=1 Tax=Roseicyclus sediminis TaxID=2980997 RepID=UPI0021D1DA96|nr:D-alanyl-D-alanine carboxypeptidase family protein [Roseibacterium sp. SDUM158016]MCU4652635.1 D-alanyl-D-alanine carboxypeptidase [Roseibacterium sp. SDUM158016]
MKTGTFDILRRTAAAFAVAVLALAAPGARAFETAAGSAWVIDHNTGQILLSHNADVPLPPASMSKLMTLLMAFEALDDGRLTLDTRLPVSAHAMSFGGSTMFLTTADRPTVEDLIRGVIVVSGNDASVVLAEALSPDGTEEGFARIATERARQLGMAQTTLRNASGWPAEGHVMSMHDLGILAERIITEHPEYYTYFAQTEFDYENRAPANRFNRNPILGLGIGADGLKTGHTQEAGYGLVGSAVQGDRRVTFVISGLDSAEARARESERIVTWAFRQFVMEEVVRGGVEIARAPVFMGTGETVGLAAAESVEMLVPALLDPEITAEITYQSPLPAPIAAGDVVGELVIRQGVRDVTQSVPLVATEDMARGGLMVRLRTATGMILGEVLGEDDAAAEPVAADG